MRAWIRGVPRGCLAVLLLLVVIAAFPKRTGAAQGQVVLTGSVVARATGQPIVDATVIVEGSGNAVRTNGVGRFELTFQPGPQTLVVSAPGYLAMRVPNVTAQTPVRIELEVTPELHGAGAGDSHQDATKRWRCRRGSDDDHRSRDDRPTRRSAVDRSGRARAGRARHDRARHLRVGALPRHAPCRQRVHQHAAPHRWRAANQRGQ